MQEIRGQIIESLRLHGGQTVDDLARAFNLSRAAVRNSLASLQADGVVARAGWRPGRRWPSAVYILTPAADALLPKAYDEFAASILAELRGEGATTLKQMLRRIGGRWVASDLPRVKGMKGRERLERGIRDPHRARFMPVLERTGKGYLLREHNCPVMRLAKVYPEVCDMLHRWLRALYGQPMARIQCQREGAPFSAYVIGASRPVAPANPSRQGNTN